MNPARSAGKGRQPMPEPARGAYIGGEWVTGAAGEMPAVSPSSGETFTTVGVADAAQAAMAVEAAAAAWPRWSARSAFERAEVLACLAEAVVRRRDDLARVLTEDQGEVVATAHDGLGEAR